MLFGRGRERRRAAAPARGDLLRRLKGGGRGLQGVRGSESKERRKTGRKGGEKREARNRGLSTAPFEKRQEALRSVSALCLPACLPASRRMGIFFLIHPRPPLLPSSLLPSLRQASSSVNALRALGQVKAAGF